MSTPVHVSVVIPVHDRAALAAEAMASVVAAAGPLACEIIVVDDGSSASEAALLEQACAAQRCCRYLRLHPNGGARAARNSGLEQVRGRYVKFLDSDDLLLPESLAGEVASLEAGAADVLVSGALQAQLEDVELVRATAVPAAHYPGNPYDAILAGFGAMTPTVLYRTEAIADVRWDLRVQHPDDWFFLIKVLLREPAVLTRDVPVCICRDHEGPRASASSLLDYAHSRFCVLDHVWQVMQERNLLTPARRQALANYYYRDIYVAQRFDSAHSERILVRLQDLVPGFVPDAAVEPRAVTRTLIQVLGMRRYIPLHNGLRRIFRRKTSQ